MYAGDVDRLHLLRASSFRCSHQFENCETAMKYARARVPVPDVGREEFPKPFSRFFGAQKDRGNASRRSATAASWRSELGTVCISWSGEVMKLTCDNVVIIY